MNIAKLVRQLRRSIGLEPGIGDYVLPAVGVLALGVLAGASVALLFAPTTGKRLREEMESRLVELRSRLLLDQGEPRAENVDRSNVNHTDPFPRSI
jgi:hypothetical protein